MACLQNESVDISAVLECVGKLGTSVLGAVDLTAALEDSLPRQDVLGSVIVTGDDFWICSTMLGDVYVPRAVACDVGLEDQAATSLILALIPSHRRRTKWRAITAKRNCEGWQSAGRPRGTAIKNRQRRHHVSPHTKMEAN